MRGVEGEAEEWAVEEVTLCAVIAGTDTTIYRTYKVWKVIIGCHRSYGRGRSGKILSILSLLCYAQYHSGRTALAHAHAAGE